jgi:hypothetical protein
MTTPSVTIPVTIAGMTTCPVCDATFVASGRRRYCSDACKQQAWRLRQVPQPPRPEARLPKHHIIYECPGCEARYLGQQRCEDCNLFCHRLGPGGLCPACDEPVAVNDLIPTTT